MKRQIVNDQKWDKVIWTSKEIYNIIKLYADTKIYLDRKYEKYLDMCNMTNSTYKSQLKCDAS